MTSTEHMDESYCDLPLVCYSSPLCLPDFGKGLGACQIIPVSEGSSHTALFCNGPISSRLTKILSSKFPGGSDSKESACSVGRWGFNPWVGKRPWRRKWPPTPVLLPGKSQGQRSLQATVHAVSKSQT